MIFFLEKNMDHSRGLVVERTRENQVYLRGTSVLFFLTLAGRLPVTLDTKRP